MLESMLAERGMGRGDLRLSLAQEWAGMVLLEQRPGRAAEGTVAVFLSIPLDEGKCSAPVLTDQKGMTGRRLQLPFAFYRRPALPVCHGTHPV